MKFFCQYWVDPCLLFLFPPLGILALLAWLLEFVVVHLAVFFFNGYIFIKLLRKSCIYFQEKKLCHDLDVKNLLIKHRCGDNLSDLGA